MSKQKTYKNNSDNKRKEIRLRNLMRDTYFMFIEVETYCMWHLDEDLTSQEKLEVQLYESYSTMYQSIVDDYPLAWISTLMTDRLNYMRDIVTKVCH